MLAGSRPSFGSLAITRKASVIDRLTLKHEQSTWYPASIPSLEQHLGIFITDNAFFNQSEACPITSVLIRIDPLMLKKVTHPPFHSIFCSIF
jgi:hypothetical protein